MSFEDASPAQPGSDALRLLSAYALAEEQIRLAASAARQESRSKRAAHARTVHPSEQMDQVSADEEGAFLSLKPAAQADVPPVEDLPSGPSGELFDVSLAEDALDSPSSGGVGWIPRLEQVEGLTSDELGPLHGALIAWGLLKFELTGRTTGIAYRLTPEGRRLIETASTRSADVTAKITAESEERSAEQPDGMNVSAA